MYICCLFTWTLFPLLPKKGIDFANLNQQVHVHVQNVALESRE